MLDSNNSKTHVGKPKKLLTVNENEKILGYAICLENSNKKIELKRIQIIDLMALNDNSEVYISLIKKCILEAKNRDYHVFEIVGFNHTKRKFFTKFKTFKRKLPSFPFYYKSQSKNDEIFLKNKEVWDPSLIDGDSFL